MFRVGDVVRTQDGPEMTVERVERCLDCNAILFDCCWSNGTGTLFNKIYLKKDLILVRVTDAPQPREYVRGEPVLARQTRVRFNLTHDQDDVRYRLEELANTLQGRWIIDETEPELLGTWANLTNTPLIGDDDVGPVTITNTVGETRTHPWGLPENDPEPDVI